MANDEEPRKRRDAIDVARVLALVLVVIGHLTLAVVDRPGDEVRGDNLLALRPSWIALASLSPMPVFFAAAGWANATATLAATASRLRMLVGLGAVVVALWSIGVVVATLVAGDAGIVADGARVATQPLWFLAAYVPLAAAGAWIAGHARSRLVVVLALSFGFVAALDVARFVFDAPNVIGWPGFFFAWGVPWVLGAWWRSRWEVGMANERLVGLAILAAGVAVAAALVVFGGYEPALIDAIPGRRSNTTPPTLFTAVAAFAQTGLLLAIARALDRIGKRWRRFWDTAGELAVGVYLWHLTALALCVGAIALGAPTPTRLTAAWWLTRPVWWIVVLAFTVALVAATAAVRGRAARPSASSVTRAVNARRALAGVVAAAAGAALIGLEGPRTVALAIVCTATLVGSYALLAPQSPSR